MIHPRRASSHPSRSRWAALGAAVAVSLGAGGLGIARAAGASGGATYVPIVPCRLADTRPATNVGPHSTPLAADKPVTFDGWGDIAGDCDLPTGTAALQLNVTAVGATQLTNVRLYPTGVDRPTVSHLNPAPDQPPTPNAVTVALNPAGRFDVLNRFGEVDVIVDVAGYYTDHHHDDRYYTKDETDAAIDTAIDGLPDAPAAVDAYTKAQTDAAIEAATTGKANTADVYSKPQTDAAIAAATAPKTYTITLGPEAFQPFYGDVVISRGGKGVWVVDGANRGFPSVRAALALPAGATITGLTYYYVDNDDDGLSMTLARNMIDTASDVFVAGTSVTTTGSSAAVRSAALTGLDIDVSTAGALSIDVGASESAWEAVDAALGFKGAVVTYTMPD